MPRAEHGISRQDISDSALKVLYRLRNAGFQAYLVGGGVRDLLLGKHPKDFDVATDALPDDAARQFKNSRLIGRRFRLLHVRFGSEIIEVATFRGHHSQPGEGIDETFSRDEAHVENGMILRDNVYGNMEEDAWRRDFTVNALYYNIADFSLIDYTGGLADLKSRTLRCIGDVQLRYCEDPVRMLRAVRLAAKLDFTIHPDSAAPIRDLAIKLNAVPPARLFEEVLKLFLSGHGVRTFELLQDFGLLTPLFPDTARCLADPIQGEACRALIRQGLFNTDLRIAESKPVTPAFLFAIMLWYPVLDKIEFIRNPDLNPTQTLHIASMEVIARQVETVSIPRRFSSQVTEIWMLQSKLSRRQGKRAYRLLEQGRFRAAYDFLLLRVSAGETGLRELADWWTDFQTGDTGGRLAMITDLGSETVGSVKRKRRRRPSRQAGH